MRHSIPKRSDGYIKNQNLRLKELRRTILLKIACVILPLAILTAVLWGTLSINSPPEKWEETQIAISDIVRERMRRRSVYAVYTTDGDRYILGIGSEETKQLAQQLLPGQQYDIVYCKNMFNKIITSLSSPDREWISREESVVEWESERDTFRIVCAITVGAALVGSIAVYVFWCKKERREAEKIKSKIDARKKRNDRHAE